MIKVSECTETFSNEIFDNNHLSLASQTNLEMLHYKFSSMLNVKLNLKLKLELELNDVFMVAFHDFLLFTNYYSSCYETCG